ncbi:hemerythrin domain-containing protein [Streptomyces sp. NRRL S-118]|uniref:hemerythrin domain-containing protein n=1 Tax=Streptomyces sp. NRRL S-118 TaxID=1463881 RepID=UPI0004CC5359|nr:hemerythrin domain-containing protein [Streptomyces sp. NRRL S-118]
MTRSIAEQNTEELGGTASILARQRRDHAELERLMERYESGDGPEEERRRVLKDIVQLTFTHAFAEETVLWPALRRIAPDGEELTARVESEHQQINDLVTEMERTGPDDPRHDELATRAFALIRQDIRDEEDLLLPRLQESLDRSALRRLGSAWETVRRTAPTHPHPVVPRRPPGNAVLGVPLSAVDRARDLLPAGTRLPSGRTLAVAAAAVCLCVAWLFARVLRARR